MIEISSTCALGKGLSVKREKAGDDGERVIAHLKFAEMFVGRDVIDDLCRRPIGWAQSTLFDDQGAPLALLELGLPANEWSVQGAIAGPGGEPRLALVGATLTGVVIALTQLGGLVSGSLSWEARGDEVEDVTDLLGKEVKIEIDLNNGGQQDLLAPLRELAKRDGITSMTFKTPGHEAVELLGTEPETYDVQPRITSAGEVLKKLQRQGFHLRGDGSSYWIEKPDGTRSQGVWLNAAKSVLKRGLEPIGEPTDEVGRWRWREQAAA